MSTSKAAFGVAERIRYSSKTFAFLDQVLKLKDSFSLNFALLFTYVLILNREGSFVPSNNEFLYLPYLAKLWNPDYLLNDWIFSGPLPSHFVFNLLFGPLTLLFPLEAVGWIGRILSWSLVFLALLRFGKHFRIPLWMITVSILLWLFYAQSYVGGEWIVGTFEAKCIAYVLLFCSLNGFMHQRGTTLPSIFLGLSFSLHPIIGLWGGLAIGLSLIVLKYSLDAIVKSGCYAALFALPGLVPMLMMPFEGSSGSFEAQRFVSLVVMPYHFDPFSFRRDKLLFLVILLCFNWLHFTANRKTYALRFLISFQTFLALFFVLGFVARFFHNYNLLMIMPCRLFPILITLFFFFHLMSALNDCCSSKAGKGLMLAGFLAFATFGNPVTVSIYKVAHHYKEWTRQEDDLQKTFKWIAKNTPVGSIVILPPWRKDSFYLSQRAQIANWHILSIDRLTEWRERLESIVGDLSGISDSTEKTQIEQMKYRYNQLASTDIQFIMDKYGAEYLVSAASYNYQVLFNSGTYKVYSLRREDLSAIK